MVSTPKAIVVGSLDKVWDAPLNQSLFLLCINFLFIAKASELTCTQVSTAKQPKLESKSDSGTDDLTVYLEKTRGSKVLPLKPSDHYKPKVVLSFDASCST